MFTNTSYRYGRKQIFQKKCRNFLKDGSLQPDPEFSLFPKAPLFLMIWIVAIRGSWSDKDCPQCSIKVRYWYSNSISLFQSPFHLLRDYILWRNFLIIQIHDSRGWNLIWRLAKGQRPWFTNILILCASQGPQNLKNT